VKVFRKGTNPGIDSYSAFFDNGHRESTGLGEWLKQQGVTDLFVLDAMSLGFKTSVIEDASRGINLQPEDVRNSLAEMKRAGAVIVQSTEVLPPHPGPTRQ
jgi:nicotinamidase/pyrazinamidase